MKSAGWMVPGGILGIGLIVYLGAVVVTGSEGSTGAAVGVILGCVFQLLFLMLARVVFPGRQLAAYGVGMLGRLILVLASAMVLVPATGLPAAPTLLPLVTVLFATTLLEPVALAAGTRKKS